MISYELKEKWNKSTYNDFINYLIGKQELEYRKFHSSLVLNSKYEMIGIRVPDMRKISKTIAKGDKESFLKCVSDKYYEEVMIEGLVISYIKDETAFNHYFLSYIHKIDNWALCDIFCSSIKIVRKHERKYFRKALELSQCKNDFVSRVGIVIILFHFVKKNNLDEIFKMLNSIKSDAYYVNMAQSWLICELYIKFSKETEEFLKNNQLNTFTLNKAISKINDSYRVDRKDKDRLKKYKRS